MESGIAAASDILCGCTIIPFDQRGPHFRLSCPGRSVQMIKMNVVILGCVLSTASCLSGGPGLPWICSCNANKSWRPVISCPALPGPLQLHHIYGRTSNLVMAHARQGGLMR